MAGLPQQIPMIAFPPKHPILALPPAMAAMVINGLRNKPLGPGGSTRRLHHSSCNAGLWGRNRIDWGVKVGFLPVIVPTLSGYFIVANDNYAPVAIAA
jgi:hypothetical protein